MFEIIIETTAKKTIFAVCLVYVAYTDLLRREAGNVVSEVFFGVDDK